LNYDPSKEHVLIIRIGPITFLCDVLKTTFN
jgi:hypothetical protein